MMGRALLVVGWSGAAGLLVSLLLGYSTAEADGGSGLHLQLALVSCLLLLFAHSWILFYLLGTRRAVRSALAEHPRVPAFGDRYGSLLRRSQWLLWPAIASLLALLVTGGAALAGVLESGIHVIVGWATVLLQAASLVRQGGVLSDNEAWIARAEALLRAEVGE